MERVGVVVHPTRPVLDALEVIERWAAAHGVEVVQLAIGEQPHLEPPGEVGRCDLVVALGGDGTILKALHTAAPSQTPVLGVAYGSLGALTTVARDELRGALDRFVAGAWRARALPALEIRADSRLLASAINDHVISRGRGTQVLIDVCVDGELYARLAGDGVILATPLGSSAYSMAAGGSLLAEGADAFLCTPLAMHGGCAPPLGVAGASVVTLDVHPGHGGYYLDVDGFEVPTDALRFEISRRESYATLVALDDAGTALSRLRARGLITDSPRVFGHARLRAQLDEARSNPGDHPAADDSLPELERLEQSDPARHPRAERRGRKG
jgi:NAD+ kinase